MPQVTWDTIDDMVHLGCVAADMSDKNIRVVRDWFARNRPDKNPLPKVAGGSKP